MKWQPIATAPKDSRARLVWCPERQNIYAATWLQGHGWQIFGGRLLGEAPSHWMELPPPPRCEYCDDSGDVHSLDSEWRGTCICPAGQNPTAL